MYIIAIKATIIIGVTIKSVIKFINDFFLSGSFFMFLTFIFRLSGLCEYFEHTCSGI